jgi:Icc-related predicted phosphoesterase
VLVVSGDVCQTGSEAEFHAAVDWMAAYPCPHKVLVPGNHDFFVDQEPELAHLHCLHRGVHLLVDETITLGGLRVHGFPWVEIEEAWNWPRHDCAFARGVGDPAIEAARKAIPADLDILVCHMPPLGIGDAVHPDSYWDCLGVERPGSAGLGHFLDRNQALPLLLYGHVHENPGVQLYNRTWCSNAAGVVVSLDYERPTVKMASIQR